jgi:hypothetical protein
MEFDTTKYKVWKLPHPLLLHWVINPGLAVNELLFGQRIPKVTVIDKTSSAPLMERQYVPCPHCHAMNDGRLWSKSNAFGHWFGYVCPECHGRIPCLWNISSLLMLALTAPVWIWFKPYAEEKWLARQKSRLALAKAGDLPEAKTTSWLKLGLGFGAAMFCMTMLTRLFLQTPPTLTELGIQALVWLGAGLAFGGVMKLFLGRGK